jgi:hypothetical protein
MLRSYVAAHKKCAGRVANLHLQYYLACSVFILDTGLMFREADPNPDDQLYCMETPHGSKYCFTEKEIDITKYRSYSEYCSKRLLCDITGRFFYEGVQ